MLHVPAVQPFSECAQVTLGDAHACALVNPKQALGCHFRAVFLLDSLSCFESHANVLLGVAMGLRAVSLAFLLCLAAVISAASGDSPPSMNKLRKLDQFSYGTYHHVEQFKLSSMLSACTRMGVAVLSTATPRLG